MVADKDKSSLTPPIFEGQVSLRTLCTHTYAVDLKPGATHVLGTLRSTLKKDMTQRGSQREKKKPQFNTA